MEIRQDDNKQKARRRQEEKKWDWSYPDYRECKDKETGENTDLECRTDSLLRAKTESESSKSANARKKKLRNPMSVAVLDCDSIVIVKLQVVTSLQFQANAAFQHHFAFVRSFSSTFLRFWGCFCWFFTSASIYRRSWWEQTFLITISIASFVCCSFWFNLVDSICFCCSERMLNMFSWLLQMGSDSTAPFLLQRLSQRKGIQ